MPKFIERIGGADLNTNPYYNDRKFVGSKGYYKNNKNHQCTNFAIGRGCEIAEEPVTWYQASGSLPRTTCSNPMFNRSGYGNAKEWFNDTNYPKTTDPNQIRLGDWVMYGSSWGGGCGHVRIVEKLDENYMYLSGGNEDGKGTPKFNIKSPRAIGGGGNAKGLQGYIHNPFVTYDIKAEDIDYKSLYLDLKKKVDDFVEKVK